MSDAANERRHTQLPVHVALIMDGNGRWAAQRDLARWDGHRAGAEAVDQLIRYVVDRREPQCLTLFAFSCENWDRPRAEVDALMALLERFAADRTAEMTKAGVCLRVIGELDGLPSNTRRAVQGAVIQTRDGKVLQLTIALNYGGQQEIVRACREIARQVSRGELTAEAVDRSLLAHHLDTHDMPDPDLIIRTGGEIRLSNFLLWQSAYAELAFTDTLWPDFTPAEFSKILEEYAHRERRYGAVKGE